MTNNQPGKLLELAGRCEAASGPHRALDAAIFQLLNPKLKPASNLYGEASFTNGFIIKPAPAYTGSLDAAMMLVRDPQSFSLSHAGNCVASVTLIGGDPCAVEPEFVAHACTPALALTAAALRALAQEHQS